MKSTKPIHYMIVIIIAIAFMGLMRFRALKQNSSPKSPDFDLSAINIDETNLEKITHYDGFGLLLIFNPNSEFFVFASNQNQINHLETNIFKT